MSSGVDPGFLERGFICIKVWGLALLILTHFSYGHMLLNTSHIEIFSILCIQFVLCMGYPFMK